MFVRQGGTGLKARFALLRNRHSSGTASSRRNLADPCGWCNIDYSVLLNHGVVTVTRDVLSNPRSTCVRHLCTRRKLCWNSYVASQSAAFTGSVLTSGPQDDRKVKSSHQTLCKNLPSADGDRLRHGKSFGRNACVVDCTASWQLTLSPLQQRSFTASGYVVLVALSWALLQCGWEGRL